MAKKILRQGLRTSPKELRALADELIKESNYLKKVLNSKADIQYYMLSIVNKQPKCSDTWQFEMKAYKKILDKTRGKTKWQTKMKARM